MEVLIVYNNERFMLFIDKEAAIITGAGQGIESRLLLDLLKKAIVILVEGPNLIWKILIKIIANNGQADVVVAD